MGGKKVIIIDDDENILKVLEIALSGFGFEVSLVSSAMAAWEIIKKDHFDLIILDYYLPKIDGPEFCRALRTKPELENHRLTPILILTGKADLAEALLAEVKAFGANDFLAKPFEIKDLLAKIQSLIG